MEYVAVVYTEPHPDKETTFLGVFSTREGAEAAMGRHMAKEKARLPQAHISEYCYSFYKGEIDHDRVGSVWEFL